MPGGAKPPVFPVAAIDDPALPEMLAELAAARADEMDADTVHQELSIARKAIGWWQRQGWTAAEHEPTPAPHSLTVSRQARQLRLPLDAYASTVAETHLVEDAQDILMRRRMKGRGPGVEDAAPGGRPGHRTAQPPAVRSRRGGSPPQRLPPQPRPTVGDTAQPRLGRPRGAPGRDPAPGSGLFREGDEAKTCRWDYQGTESGAQDTHRRPS